MISKSEVINYLRFQKDVFGDSLYVDKEALELKIKTFKDRASSDSNKSELAKSITENTKPIVEELTIKKDKKPAPVISNSEIPKKEKSSVKKGWENSTTLQELNSAINTCVECPLGLTRDKFVFGTGDPNADLMIIGEAPGADEDAKGEPFVGRAGKLLTKILEAINFKREDVFIANILKCRPPNNRRPEKTEVDECEPYLKKQIEIIKPKFILALGLTSVDTLLKKKHKMKDTRGEILSYHGIKLMVTYHPAALLRNPNWKKDTWEDVQKLRKLYDEARA